MNVEIGTEAAQFSEKEFRNKFSLQCSIERQAKLKKSSPSTAAYAHAVAKVEVNNNSLHLTAQSIIIYQSLRGSWEEKQNSSSHILKLQTSVGNPQQFLQKQRLSEFPSVKTRARIAPLFFTCFLHKHYQSKKVCSIKYFCTYCRL